MFYNFFRALAILILKAVFGLQVFDRENIPKKGGFILASNHTSYLDPIVLGAACSRKLNFMAKQELFSNAFFSWFISNLGSFPVKRKAADLLALKEAMRRIKKGGGLLLFPEGTRRFDGVSCEPHGGVGFLAAKLDVPVVPAFIRGTDSALPKGAKFMRPGQISVYFGKQISVEKNSPYQDITRLVMANIRYLEENS